MSTKLERRGLELGLAPKEAFEETLDVKDIPDEGLFLHFVREPAWIAEDVQLAKPLDVWLLLFQINGEITADVEGHSSLRVECSRCLKLFDLPISIELRSMFLPSKPQESEEEVELNEEDLGVTFYSGPEIDLGSFLREEVLLMIPVQPLCSPSCPGLCSQCGADLSSESCQCQKPVSDSRFSALAGLLETMRKEPQS